MNTYGVPYPIPLFEVAGVERGYGPNGNSPVPMSFLEMSMDAASYLYYKAKRIQYTHKFKPLAAGPGVRIPYESLPGWNNDTAISSGYIDMLEPLPLPTGIVVDTYATDQAARDGIRGYAVTSWSEPTGSPAENVGHPGDPGYWMGIGHGGIDIDLSAVDGSMRYNCDSNYEELVGAFYVFVADALEAWQTRLDNWLIAEQAKVPQNLVLIADITRQLAARTKIAEQVNFQADNMVSIVSDKYMVLYNALPADKKALAGHFGANLITAEQESFANWIAAEEQLEAYAILGGILKNRREPFRFEFLRKQNHLYFGWARGARFGSLGASLVSSAIDLFSTGAISPFTTAALPALTNAKIALDLSQPSQEIIDELPQGAADIFRSVFELKTPYTLAGSTEELEALVRTSIGPITLGLSEEACNIGPFVPFQIPERADVLRVIGSGFLSGTGAGSCPVENPDCDPYIIRFGQIFDTNGDRQLPFDSSHAENAEGEKAWAFQTSLVTYSGDPNGSVDATGLATAWQSVADAIKAKNLKVTNVVSECGSFTVVNKLGDTLTQQPLYTQTGSLDGLDVVWEVTEEWGDSLQGGGV
jgi:hypothetical protein